MEKAHPSVDLPSYAPEADLFPDAPARDALQWERGKHITFNTDHLQLAKGYDVLRAESRARLERVRNDRSGFSSWEKDMDAAR